MKRDERLEVDVLAQLEQQKGDRFLGELKYKSFSKNIARDRGIRIFRGIVKYAAVVAITLLGVYTFTAKEIEQQQTILSNEIYVPIAQRTKFTLHDGTVVWLNSQTTLSYPSVFAENERKVKLDGEAYFEVAKDCDRPFIVEVDDAEIKVLGTTFNVSNYDFDDYIMTSLLEGSVEVIKGGESIKLKPNEQITIKGDKYRVEPIAHNEHFMWINGIYAFENEKLIDVIRRLELYYEIEIEIKNESKFQSKYTGKFRQNDGVHLILELINIMDNFEIIYDRDRNRIILK